jgi:hypothetical protein
VSRVIDIQPATMQQVTRTDKGRLIAMGDDVQGVAKALHEIDQYLTLSYDPDQEYFIVRRDVPQEDGSVDEQLVLTARELDHRIVARVKEIGSEDYDYVGELDRLDAEADRRKDKAHSEKMGDAGERLRHALRQDLGYTDRAFIGGD